MAAGGHLNFDGDYYYLGIYTMNKTTPVWRRSVKRFRSYRIYSILASYHFMDGKMCGGNTCPSTALNV
jgi:hypothetical protein